MTMRQIRHADGPTLRLMAAAALVVASACAAPILATETVGNGDTGATPVDCGIAIDSVGGMTTFRPWVRVDPVQTGSYSFALAGGGTVIDQGGSFEVGAGGQAMLGEATVSGPASRYDVELTVTVGGTDYRCRSAYEDI